MIRRMIRYFFPKRSLRQRIPLALRRPTSTAHPWRETTAAEAAQCRALMTSGVARTEADAYRLLKRHAGASVAQIVVRERPKRRKTPALRRIWRKIKRVW